MRKLAVVSAAVAGLTVGLEYGVLSVDAWAAKHVEFDSQRYAEVGHCDSNIMVVSEIRNVESALTSTTGESSPRYNVYRKTGKRWKLIHHHDLTSYLTESNFPSALCRFYDRKLKSATKYWYRAEVVDANGKVIAGGTRKVSYWTAPMRRATLKSKQLVKSKGLFQPILSWKPVKGASGYMIKATMSYKKRTASGKCQTIQKVLVKDAGRVAQWTGSALKLGCGAKIKSVAVIPYAKHAKNYYTASYGVCGSISSLKHTVQGTSSSGWGYGSGYRLDS